jgi:threonine/homoserine/homoserine lactone efflux protein
LNWATWLTVAGICALGAMSPGPSLAVVLRQTLSGGRANGCVAAITHGLGIGIYALLSISGLALLITASPTIFNAFQWAGAAYLAWLGWRGLTAKTDEDGEPPSVPTTASAARDGFSIVFFNPKIAVFFIALFSQVIGPETSLPVRLAYATTAMLIDAAWYLLVAWLFSSPRWLGRLHARAVWFERLFGVILLGFAMRLIYQSIVAP